jgi:hypothetical protein
MHRSFQNCSRNSMNCFYLAAFILCLLFGDAVAFSVLSPYCNKQASSRLHLGRSDENHKKTFAHSNLLGFVVKQQSAEDYLHQEGIVPLNEPRDLDYMNGLAPLSLIHRASIRPKHLSVAELASIPIFIVDGKQGYNRRSFAVTVAATYGLNKIKQSKYVTLYINLYELRQVSCVGVKELVAWIKREIKMICGSSDKLNMHVSLVIDPGRSNWNARLSEVVQLLKRDVAESVRLVVCGNGYTNVPTGTDSFLIHCRGDTGESTLTKPLSDLLKFYVAMLGILAIFYIKIYLF